MESYIVGIISALLGYVSSRFANRNHTGLLPTIGVVSILAITAAGLTFGGHWISTPRPPKDRLEGQWIERYKSEAGDTHYGLATIRYNSEAKYLEFYGDAYESTLDLVGHWKTVIARLDGNRYDYVFEGKSNNPKKSGPRNGVGSIWFLENGNHGDGQFISVREDRTLRDFDLYRILDENAVKESINNPKGFVSKLYKGAGYFEQVTSPH